MARWRRSSTPCPITSPTPPRCGWRARWSAIPSACRWWAQRPAPTRWPWAGMIQTIPISGCRLPARRASPWPTTARCCRWSCAYPNETRAPGRPVSASPSSGGHTVSPAIIMIQSRYRRIVFFFARVIATLIFWDIVLPRVGLRGWSRSTRRERLRRLAVLYRALAIRMGGVLIKVGQFLSARVDVLPEEVTAELAGLQDEVPAEKFDDIRRLAEAELGAPLAQRFAAFDPVPLAAASLGQVHRARLRPETEGGPETAVVVKVQRPKVELLIATDLAALDTVGNWIKYYPPIRRRADVPALLAEFARILRGEIDYLAEGRNAETFAANFKDTPGVRVPHIYWPYTTRRVLTLEDVYAIKITDYEAITAAGIDRAEVAERLFQTYLRQIFEQGFFHADPHPGNLFVERLAAAPAGGPSWRLIFVDFGMMGHVPPNLRAGLREMAIGVATRDAARLVHASQTMGILLP